LLKSSWGKLYAPSLRRMAAFLFLFKFVKQKGIGGKNAFDLRLKNAVFFQ
jgi:hypothetical protein